MSAAEALNSERLCFVHDPRCLLIHLSVNPENLWVYAKFGNLVIIEITIDTALMLETAGRDQMTVDLVAELPRDLVQEVAWFRRIRHVVGVNFRGCYQRGCLRKDLIARGAQSCR